MNPRLIKLPPTLQYAVERLEDFVNKPYKFGFITYNRPGKPRLMRSERRENVRKVLLALVRHMDVVSGRIIRPLGADKGTEVYADCSLSWLGRASGVSRRTLCRVIVDLESVGWLQRDRQIIMRGMEPETLLVATVVRRLTQHFFEALGLVKDWLRDKEHLEYSRLARMVTALFRLAHTKAKNAVKRQGFLPDEFHTPRMDPADLKAWIGRQTAEVNAAWRSTLNPKVKEIVLALIPPQNP